MRICLINQANPQVRVMPEVGLDEIQNQRFCLIKLHISGARRNSFHFPSTVASLVEYLATTRLGEKGQMTVPKEYREALKLQTGAPVAVLRVGDGLILMPEQTRFQKLCDSLAAALEGAGISETHLQSTLAEARRRVVTRRYPKLLSDEKPKLKRKKK